MAKLSGEIEVGRRLKFRDLQVFFAVVEAGTMAEAGRQLGLTQPAVSEVIAQLELLFGARLFDRDTRGVEPTIYGRALLKRAQAALDEVKQGVRDIAFLTDPTRGEVRIGCAQRLSAAIMPQIVERFSQTYPRIVLHIDEVAPLTRDLSGLRDRKYDLMMGRPTKPLEQGPFGDDVNIDILFDDKIIVAAGKVSRWARRRKIEDLAALIDARWILTSGAVKIVGEAFPLRGLSMPNVTLITSSSVVASHLLAKTDSVTVTSQFAAKIAGLNVLPIDLGLGPWPALIITLKNRTLNPVAERFIACAHEVVKSIASRSNSRVRAKPNVKTQEPLADTERRLRGD
jgi:DNA-binding transcriptional LysR family regulator